MTAAPARLRWQCRRGLLELDYLLEAFLEQEYPRLDETGRRRFADLLTRPDPELQAWLLHGTAPDDPALAPVVARLRALRV